VSNRGYTDRELRLVTEWSARTWPGARVIQRYRINLPPPFVPQGWTLDDVLRLMKPTGFMVDAVVVVPGITFLVEAKTDNESQAIGQLAYYTWLIAKYSKLQEFPTENIQPVLLYARINPELEAFATSLGIAVEHYSPEWIQTFLRQGYTGGG
jgi:hypothetical protein